jgi:hypothetical protein
MLRTNFALPGLSLLFCHALLGAGCLITTSDGTGDDSNSDESTGGGSASLSTTESVSGTSSNPDETGDDSIGETTSAPTGECSNNLIADGGFEAGTPSDAWIEMSDNFGTPICDVDCTEEPGADPYAGDWYAWFGGIDTDPEVGSVRQDVTIGGTTAFLSFRFEINASSQTGDDFFEVTIDDESVWIAVDTEIADFDGYTPVTIDISDFADGAGHTIAFTGDVLGNGLTNFFLDEVSLVTCTEGADTSGSGGSSDGSSSGSDGTTAGDTTAASESSSDSGSGSGSESGTGTSGSTGV